MKEKVVIIGAGPAGLTAGDLLSQQGHLVEIFETHPKYVGGLSKTVTHKGFCFDIGGHRFYTKAPEVETYWKEVLGDKFLRRSRMSRIFYNQKFFNYPLELGDVITKIPFFKGVGFFLSYLQSKILSRKEVKSFEDWVVGQFGRELYLAFFKSYTEKVWGRPCEEISADWAAQRINNLNIGTIIFGFLKKILGLNSKNNIKSLISAFDYPKKGPGMLWEKVRERIESRGGIIHMGETVSCCIQSEDQLWSVSSEKRTIEKANAVISTTSIQRLLTSLSPAPQSLKESDSFKYRDFLTVVLMFKRKESFPDNWIYIHDERVKVARIQNYKNWSPHMVPSDEYTSYGLEYFCQEGDELWSLEDKSLFELAKKEISLIGLPISEAELDYVVIRVPKAYPVYDHDHKERIERVGADLSNYPGLHLCGRNGLHRYNNQDHSIKTAMLVSQNIIENELKYDPWAVNQDAIYLEKK